MRLNNDASDGPMMASSKVSVLTSKMTSIITSAIASDSKTLVMLFHLPQPRLPAPVVAPLASLVQKPSKTTVCTDSRANWLMSWQQQPALQLFLVLLMLLAGAFSSNTAAGSLNNEKSPRFAAATYADAPDYAAWAKHNQDGSWTRAAEHAVASSSLPRLIPTDATQFCPTYPKLGLTQRKQFWVALISAMSGPESNFRPASSYQERFSDRQGRPVVSRGLLQISQESANQRRYGCDIRQANLLHDPVINLSCGVRILSRWVQQDGLIASQHSPKGGGRYWSTLRHQNGKTGRISAFTRALPFCGTKAHPPSMRTASLPALVNSPAAFTKPAASRKVTTQSFTTQSSTTKHTSNWTQQTAMQSSHESARNNAGAQFKTADALFKSADTRLKITDTQRADTTRKIAGVRLKPSSSATNTTNSGR